MFTPEGGHLATLRVGTLLHFQWTGSDANNNNNAGQAAEKKHIQKKENG